MPLRETEAIVLRTYRLGEADKIVSLFTRQQGRLRAVASGAQRTKSRYGGTLEPLSYVRIWLFERENRDLLRLNSAELVESFFDMQRDYGVQVAAHYMAEVSERMLPERETNERAFRLLLAVLRGLKRSREVDRPLLYFDYWLLRLAGFLPDVEHCAVCGRDWPEDRAWYGAGSDGLLCRGCRLSNMSGNVSAASLAVATAVRQTPLERWMAQSSLDDAVRELRGFFEWLIEAQTEKKLVTRELLAEF